MSTRILGTTLFLCLAMASWGRSGELAPPVRLEAGGQPIDVAGFAAPFVADVDGDGLRDLLVGQDEGGKLRIYLNRGTNRRPKFESFTWYQADGADARVAPG